MAELNEGDGRGLTKIKTSGWVSPVSSPNRRIVGASGASGGLTLHPLSPRATSILDHSGSGGRSASSSGGPSVMLSTASARVLSVLEEQRRMGSPSEGPYSATGLPGTPPRKATSAPDSQSLQAQQRTSANPWRPGPCEQPAPLSDPEHAQHAGVSPAAPPGAPHGHSHSHRRGHGHSPSPPPGAAGDCVSGGGTAGRCSPAAASGSGGGGAGSGGCQAGAANGLPPAPPAVATGAGGGGGGRQRRDSVSSTDSHSVGTYDSPGGSAGAQHPSQPPSSLRVATLGRTGSPNSPSTPSTSCSSQPHTPTFSALRPRPPGDAPTPSSRSLRKLSHLASPEARQGQHQHHQPHPPQQGSEPQGAASSLGAARALSLQTGQDEIGPPLMMLRSASLRSEGGLAAPLGGSSQPGTPSSVASASRPSSGRAGSARTFARPVAALVDAVRSRDDGKLAEVLEALRAPQQQGAIQGLNDRHHMTYRTALHEAAISNSPSMVAMLLAAGADANIGHPTQGPPLLHCAAFGELETLLLLLQAGADVRAADIERNTALHFACVGGHADVARLLMKYGADLHARNEEGQVPLDLASPMMLRLVMAVASPPGDDAGGEAVTSPERPSPPSSASAARRMSEAAAAAAAARAAASEVASEGGAAAAPGLSGRGGSGGTRRGGSGGGGGSGRPPSGSSGGGGMQYSPTVQIVDTSGAVAAGGGAGAGALRPAPPPVEPQAPVALASHPRSRRGSSACTPASGVVAAAAPQLVTHGLSPLRHDSGGAISSVTTTPTPAPASPLFSDGEAAPPPASPPTLQLPGGVRRQLSRGAVLGDIMTAFQQEDAEMVRKSMPGAALHAAAAAGGMGAGGGGAVAAAQPHPPLPPGQAAGKPKDTRAAAAAPVGFVPPRHAMLASQPQPQPQPAVQPPLAAAAAPQIQGKDTGADKPEGQRERDLLPFNVPETSVIRFGVRLQVHGPDEDADGGGGREQPAAAADASAASVDFAASASRQPSGALAMPSFSSGVAATGFTPPPLATAASGGGAGAGGFNAVGFMPVPATGFTPRFSSNGGGGDGGHGHGGAAAHRVSGSGDDFGVPAPPLMRDSSPVRNRPSNSGAAAGPGSGSPAGAGAAGSGGGGAGGGGGRNAPTRSSQRAAEALKRMSQVGSSMSMDAIEVRAAAMFRQSTELTTGEMAWTKGELLGEGAYGKVYAGLNQQTGELMAVKVLQLVTKSSCSSKEAIAQLEALEHEMSLYKLLKHKHVVGYIDARFDPETSAFYIFLEYVPGGSIASMLTRFGRFSEDLVRNYTRQLLLGLEYLHGRKIVHRDLKGGNVLVSRDGVVKLADFGASKAYRDHTITDCMKSVRGSVFWMAPEVIRGTGYGRRADIWSLGCTVIEMLTGTHPWPGLDNQWTAMFTIAKTQEGPPRPRGASEEALRFLDKCLQFDPAKRPTAAELLQDPFVARPGGGPAAGDERLQHSF